MVSPRRRAYRVPTRLDAELLLPTQNAVTAIVADISSAGLGFLVKARGGDSVERVRRVLPTGGPVHLQVLIDGRPLVLTGHIRWSRPAESDDVRAGVSFEKLDGPSKKVLSRWLVQACEALRRAAEAVLKNQWVSASAALETLGIQRADRATVQGVLQYAAGDVGGGSAPH